MNLRLQWHIDIVPPIEAKRPAIYACYRSVGSDFNASWPILTTLISYRCIGAKNRERVLLGLSVWLFWNTNQIASAPGSFPKADLLVP